MESTCGAREIFRMERETAEAIDRLHMEFPPRDEAWAKAKLLEEAHEVVFTDSEVDRCELIAEMADIQITLRLIQMLANIDDDELEAVTQRKVGELHGRIEDTRSRQHRFGGSFDDHYPHVKT